MSSTNDTDRITDDTTAQPSTPTEENAPDEAPVRDTPDEPPTCRICFSGAEAGRLFSPCRCRGTMKHVHVHCLDAWRRASMRRGAGDDNNQVTNRHTFSGSYAQCDQCHFRYRMERSVWAARLEDKRVPGYVAAGVLLLAVLATGYITRLLSEKVALSVCSRIARALKRAPTRYAPFITGESNYFQKTLKFFERLSLPRPDHAFRTRLLGAYEASGSVSDTNPLRRHYARVVQNTMKVWSSHGGSNPIDEQMSGTSPLHVEFLFYSVTGWSVPPWWDPINGYHWMVHRVWVADFLDRLVAGVTVVGVCGFAAHAYTQYKQSIRLGNDLRNFGERVFLPVASLFISRGAGASRLLFAGGMFWVAVTLHSTVTDIAKRMLQRFGERVLEPSAEELRTE